LVSKTELEFPEFLVALDFMRRCVADSTTAEGLRGAFRDHTRRQARRKSLDDPEVRRLSV